MTHSLTRSLSATAAISAVLALGSTPVMAQETAPVVQAAPPIAAPATAPITSSAPAATSVTAPTAAPVIVPQAAAPKPTIVLPDVSTVEASAPAATRTEPRPAPRAAGVTRARAETARAEPRATASEAPAPRASQSAASDVAPPVAPVAQRSAAPARAPAQPAPINDNGIPGEALAGLLAALGIGVVGYAVMRSRRRREDDELTEDYVAEEQFVTGYTASDEPERAPRTAPVFGSSSTPSLCDVNYGFSGVPADAALADAEVIARDPIVQAPVARPAQPARQAVPMPSGAPMTAEERSLLLDRMVAAEPDEANPFVSGKARRKRARLMLQQHEHELENTNTPFDWRTYRPETKPSTPAAPTLVTA